MVIGSPVVRGNRFAISKSSPVSGSEACRTAFAFERLNYPPPIFGIRTISLSGLSCAR